MISQEAIEAALEAYAEGVYLTDEQVRASVIRIVEAALPFLPIAVEGKEPLDWEDPVTRAKVIHRARQLWNEDQFSCAWSDENREHYMIRAAFELAPSSPGKDDGQEVEAVELSGISKELAEESGFWRSCSGCHNLNEGVPTGPYSRIMQCHLGFGCRECGGIGAIWDNVDYSDFGLHEINEAQP